jgi:dihydrofolate reductase
MANNRVIGYKNQLPWHLPADLKHFKALTLGKPVIMGRKTFMSIGKPLPGRQNIVITSQELNVPNVTTVNSLTEAITKIQPCQEIMIIGGATLYESALPIATRMYLTFIDHTFTGDTFFPKWNASEWHEINRKNCHPDEKNPYHYSFVTFERIKIKL